MTDPRYVLPPAGPSGALERAAPAVPTAWAGGVPAAATTSPSDWQRYLAAVLRHKWLVLAVTAAGTVAGFVATRFLDPRYAAKAILWIESVRREPERGLFPSEELLDPTGWIELVRSSAVLDSVVAELRLFLTPRVSADSVALASFAPRGRLQPGRYVYEVDDAGRTFRLRDAGGGLLQMGAVGDSVGQGLGFGWAPSRPVVRPGQRLEFTVAAPYDAAQALGKALSVRLDAAGNFLRIELKGPDPGRAAATVTAVAERVVSVAADLKRQKFAELVQILSDQLVPADRALRAAESALNEFRVRTAGTVPVRADRPEAGGAMLDPAGAASVGLRVDLEGVRQDRRALERVLASGGGPTVEALAGIGAVQRSPDLTRALQEAVAKRAELRALRYRYTEESAPVQQAQAALQALQRQLPTLARDLVADLRVQEAQLAPRVDAAVRTLRRLPPLALQEARLTRDLANAEALYTNVRQRYEAARLALLSSLPDVRILDRAGRPQRPVSDFAPLLVLLAFATSLVAVVLGVTLRDQLDTKVRYPEQVTQGMHLTILGAVPRVSRRLYQAGGDGAAPVIEALRGLRLRLLHAPQGGPVLVTLTSPGPGEGKSFVSANLALAFAHAGYRTALVDGDIRRGVQHHAFGVDGVPGLTDVLSSRADVDAAVQQTPYPGLWLLPAGTRLLRGPELLLTQRMRDVVASLRQQYDVVIVDSPPLTAGVDALALATLTGSMILVLRAGATDLQMALSRLETVDVLPVTLLGVVLNDVRRQGAYRYYTYEDLGDYQLPAADRRDRGDVELPIVGGAP